VALQHSAKDEHMLIGSVRHCDVIVIDDIIDTGSRMSVAADLCKEEGAKRIFGFATHGIFSGRARKRVDDSAMDEFLTTNTIQPKQFQVTVRPMRTRLG